MAWQSLKNQTDALPLVLAGPILRRTEQKAVTVWLALKEPRTVTLRVARKDIPDQAVLRSAPRAPIKLGQHLYVVAVTARPDTGTLDPGHIYLYDIDFGNGQTLMSPKVVTAQGGLSAQARVSYPGVGLPSFALPPANIQQLRLVHGSCRKPHGDCWDALSALDTILDLTYGNANARPHQLFLTGDRIYADDVADALLFMIHDRQSALGLTQESLPGIPSDPRMLLAGVPVRSRDEPCRNVCGTGRQTFDVDGKEGGDMDGCQESSPHLRRVQPDVPLHLVGRLVAEPRRFPDT